MKKLALVGSLAALKHVRFMFSAAGTAALAFNGLGIQRKKLRPMNLGDWDKAVERGEIPLDEFASPLSDLRTTPRAGYFLGVAAVDFAEIPHALLGRALFREGLRHRHELQHPLRHVLGPFFAVSVEDWPSR